MVEVSIDEEEFSMKKNKEEIKLKKKHADACAKAKDLILHHNKPLRGIAIECGLSVEEVLRIYDSSILRRIPHPTLVGRVGMCDYHSPCILLSLIEC